MATTIRKRPSAGKGEEGSTGNDQIPPTKQLFLRPSLKKNPRMVMYHTLTSKGQLTIPYRVREEMGLQPGEKVGFMKEGEDWILVRPRDVVRRTAGRGKKYVEALGRTHTIEEESEAYEQGVADEVVRSMSEEE